MVLAQVEGDRPLLCQLLDQRPPVATLEVLVMHPAPFYAGEDRRSAIAPSEVALVTEQARQARPAGEPGRPIVFGALALSHADRQGFTDEKFLATG